MIIAIDGPAGAGKSTTARAVARRFGFCTIDTGAMYRAVALAARERGLETPRDDAQIVELARGLPIALKNNGQSTFIGERDVSELIRTPEIGALTSQISAIPGVRAVIVEQQRRLARCGERECGGAVLEGRDIQTVVFPDAEVKIFLTAGTRTRASRRRAEWETRGECVSLDDAERDIETRDTRDSTRETSPLQPAPDAVRIETDDLSVDEVVQRIAAIAESLKRHDT